MDKTLVIGKQGVNLRLLGHDLGDPDGIRIFAALPVGMAEGQVALVLGKPGKECFGDGRDVDVAENFRRVENSWHVNFLDCECVRSVQLRTILV